MLSLDRRRMRFWIRVTAIALAASLLMLVVGTLLFAREAAHVQADTEVQSRLDAQLVALQDTLNDLLDAETGQRGYLLTDKPRYLQPYDKAVAAIGRRLDGLDRLTDLTPVLEARRADLRATVRRRLELLSATIALQRDGRGDEALALVQTDEGLMLMTRVRGHFDAIERHISTRRTELSERASRSIAEARRLAVWTVSALLATIVLLAAQLTALGLSTRRHAELLRDSERRHRAILESQHELVSLATPDGVLTYANPAFAKHVGVDAGSLIGRSLYDFVDADDRARVATAVARVLDSGAPARNENRVRAADGTPRWMAWVNSVHTGADGEKLLHSVGRDITDRVVAQARLEQETATLHAVLEAIPAVVAVVEAAGGQIRYRYVNTAFERWRARPRAEIVGRSLLELFGPHEHERTWPWLERAVGGETLQFDKTYADARDHRHMALTYVPLRLPDGRIDGVIAMAQDVTSQREREQRLVDLSERDPLTGLLNRAGLHRVLEQTWRREPLAVAILYIDLDHFKPVNDRHGHAAGDEVLRRFAERLQRLVRPTDAVCRLGGDEFAVALIDVGERGNAERVADKIVEATRAPFVAPTFEATIGASVGVAFSASRDERWQDLVERADAGVYAAKAQGRGRRA